MTKEGSTKGLTMSNLIERIEAAEGPWIVVNIGCIECGVTSNIVGVFADKAVAEAHAERLDESHGWREGGQNSYEVFPMPPIDTLAEEYQARKADNG